MDPLVIDLTNWLYTNILVHHKIRQYFCLIISENLLATIASAENTTSIDMTVKSCAFVELRYI